MRVLKFVKYLPQFGWRPIVLTVRPEYYRLVDKSLLAEVPSVATVIPTRSLQSKGKSYQKVLDTVHKAPRGARSILSAMYRRAFRHFLARQDEDFLWLPCAWGEANRILQEQRVDLIMTTSPPHCAQWLGLALRKRHRIPWVVDLRDGWTGNPLFHVQFPPRRWIDRQVERAVMLNADRVIAATGPILDDLVRNHPHISGKSLVLTNGFDPADFAGIPAKPNNSFAIVYVGSLAGPRRPVEPLLRAVAHLMQQSPNLAQVLRLRFVGSFGPTEFQLVEEYQLTSVVTCTGWVEHRDAIQHMLSADVLLLISSNEEGGKDVLTGKLFEYIAAERPILTLAPPDAAVSRLVHQEGLGVVASPTDVHEIGAAIRNLYERFCSGTLHFNTDPGFKQKFSRVEQTRTLAHLLAEVASRAKS